MKLNPKELALIAKHNVDEIIFMSKKQPKVIYNLDKLMAGYEEDTQAFKLQALQKALSQED
jgi:hypothetical protein